MLHEAQLLVQCIPSFAMRFDPTAAACSRVLLLKADALKPVVSACCALIFIPSCVTDGRNSTKRPSCALNNNGH